MEQLARVDLVPRGLVDDAVLLIDDVEALAVDILREAGERAARGRGVVGEGDPLREIELLGADGFRHAELRGGAGPVLDFTREHFAELLAALRKAELHQPIETRAVARRRIGARREQDDRGLDLRHRREDGRRQSAEIFHVPAPADEERGAAVFLRARRGGEALRELALEREDHRRDRRRLAREIK